MKKKKKKTYFSDQIKFIPLWADRAVTISRLRINSSSCGLVAGTELGIGMVGVTFNELFGLWMDVEGCGWKAILNIKIDANHSKIEVRLNYNTM